MVILNDADIVRRVRAGDVAQETFIHSFMGLEHLRDPDRFGPWLRQMAVNRCRMWQRQHRVTETLDAAPSLANPVGQVETRLAVRQALSCLSDPLRLTI